MENEKFTSLCTVDYKTYKEFKNAVLVTNKINILILSIIFLLLIILLILNNYNFVFIIAIACLIALIILKVINLTKLGYKQTLALNNGEVLKQNIEINGDSIILTSQKNDSSSYDVKQIIEIVETDNLFILKLKYNVGILVDKDNLNKSKEELLAYLYTKCSNLKSKKVINYKKWKIIRIIILVLITLVMLLSFFLVLINSNKMDRFIETYRENNYNVEVTNDNYNYRSIEITNNENSSDETLMIYRFTDNEKAEEFFDELLDFEITREEKNQYLIEDSGNYQKYIIEDYKYTILIKDGKYIYYGTSDSDPEQKENLESMLALID